MGFWIASILLLFVAGYWLGKWQNRNYKRDRRVALARKLQLIAERNEHMGYRRKHQRPLLTSWQKWLLAFLYGLSPTFTRYTPPSESIPLSAGTSATSSTGGD